MSIFKAIGSASYQVLKVASVATKEAVAGYKEAKKMDKMSVSEKVVDAKKFTEVKDDN